MDLGAEPKKFVEYPPPPPHGALDIGLCSTVETADPYSEFESHSGYSNFFSFKIEQTSFMNILLSRISMGVEYITSENGMNLTHKI